MKNRFMLDNLKKLEVMILLLALEPAKKKELLQVMQSIRKDHLRLDFMFKRTLKDKSIAGNLLTTTIKDLQEKKKEIEEKNTELEEKKRLVEKQSQLLQKHLRALEIAYRELEQFAYIGSHDLKIPLSTIANFADRLQHNYQSVLDKQGREFIQFIQEKADYMQVIIQDLLSYSEAGGGAKKFTEVNLNHAIGIARFNILPLIQEHQAVIEHPELPRIIAIKEGVIELFQHLLTNAIEFRGPQAPRIQISLEQEDGHWHFQLSHNGLSLDLKQQEKVFQPFERLDHARKGQLPGSMGLAICKKIVRLHNGDIWYESKPEGGATFHFTLTPPQMS